MMVDCARHMGGGMRKSTHAINQVGMTLVGMLLVISALVIVSAVDVKVVPAYVEFFSVKMALNTMSKEPLNNMSKSEIISSFNQHRDNAYFSIANAKDINLKKDSDGDTVISVDYQVIKPIVNNVSVLMHFVAKSKE